MLTRRAVIASLAPLPIAAYGQSLAPVKSSIIGAGPFEFPIPGTYTYERQLQGMLISTADGKRVYSTSQFGSPARDVPGGHISRLEQLTRRNWEKFALDEKGVVAREFRRTDISSSLAVFSMAKPVSAAAAVGVRRSSAMAARVARGSLGYFMERG